MPSELEHGDSSEIGAEPVGVGAALTDGVGVGVPEWPPQAENARDAATSPIPNSRARVRLSRGNVEGSF